MLVVDAANVIGSRPDGWWRDRGQAAAKLCGRLSDAVASGRLEPSVVVILEGAARPGVEAGTVDRVRVRHAPGSGDDAIVAAAGEAVAEQHIVTVVTADRELRRRVQQLGCEVVGPRWLLDRL